MMIIDTKYEFGDIVYLSTDTEQKKRLVTGVTLTLKEFEITEEENILIKSEN